MSGKTLITDTVLRAFRVTLSSPVHLDLLIRISPTPINPIIKQTRGLHSRLQSPSCPVPSQLHQTWTSESHHCCSYQLAVRAASRLLEPCHHNLVLLAVARQLWPAIIDAVGFEVSAPQLGEPLEAHLVLDLLELGQRPSRTVLLATQISLEKNGSRSFRCLVLARFVADLVEAVSRYEGGLVHPLGIIGLELEQSKYV